MKRSILSLFLCAAVATVIVGCGSFGGSTAPTAQNNVNLTELLNNVSNTVAQLDAAYTQFKPQINQIEQLIGAWKAHQTADTNCASCSDKVRYRAPVAAARAAAVVCGLTRVDPKAYNGWPGDCPGCDVDAQAFAMACQAEGVPHETLLNEKANYLNIVAACKRALETLNPGDLLIFYISGHGGQTPAPADASEIDGKSETLCLWDGQLVDDKVWTLLQQTKAKGVKVWMITDTCNSGTNYRSPHNYVRGLSKRISPDDPQLLHWGGCADGKSSFGSAQGGTFTTALVDAYKHGQSYADWFRSIQRRMPLTQRPTVAFTGADFQTLTAFQ